MRGHPRHDHRHGRQDRRPPGQLARRRRADRRAPSAARQPDRQDRLGHRPPGLRAQAADRPARSSSARCASSAAWAASRAAARASTTSSTAAMPAPGLSIAEGLALAREQRGTQREDRGRRRRRGADERHGARGAQRHRPPPDADADRAQRQRDEHLAHGRRDQPVPVAGSSCRAPGAARSASTTTRSSASRCSGLGSSTGRAGCASRSSTSPSPGQLFEDLGITYVGPGARPQPARAEQRLPPRAARHGRAGHRPRPDPEGPRLPAGRGRPGELPRRGAAAHDRRPRRGQWRAISTLGQERRR